MPRAFYYLIVSEKWESGSSLAGDCGSGSPLRLQFKHLWGLPPPKALSVRAGASVSELAHWPGWGLLNPSFYKGVTEDQRA